MTKRLQSITNKKYAIGLMLGLLLLWQGVCTLGLVPPYMLPSPIQVMRAFYQEFDVLMGHLMVSMSEAFLGLGISVIVAFGLAVVMDRYEVIEKMIYPLLIISQTVPVIAIAPLLVLWMGYGMTPKIVVIFLVCFFPITIALLDGFKSVDPDAVRLLKSMGGSQNQIFWHIKLPYSLPNFFAGLKVSVSYAVIGAVVAEWLGGSSGLGVYMTRVRKSYAFDKMFAVIFLVSIVSLILMKLVSVLERKMMPYKEIKRGTK
ncbi:MAG: ABC transporter permease [Cellulosilyticaceae bacterium]